MLACESIRVTYGENRALDDVSLEVAGGDIVAVMGESGSGKTTLLRVISGLVRPNPGSVFWAGRNVTEDPVHVRGFGLMFQDYALFPHLSVGGNVAFGLRMAGESVDQQRQIVDRMLTLVGLAGYAGRAVAELSGGEQQRVALARTLAPAPAMVLLDEPLGALDRARRDQLLSDMQHIFSSLGVTALYVTHDHHEAFAIADQVVVLDSGRKVAHGSPTQLWQRPGHLAVATLLGFPILRQVAVHDGVAVIGGVDVTVAQTDGDHNLALPPGSAQIAADGTIPVTVRARRFEDGIVKAVVNLDGAEIVAVAPAGTTLGPAMLRIDTAALVAVAD